MFEYRNEISLDEYCELRAAVGWGKLEKAQVTGCINGSDFITTCRFQETIIGMARIFWDKGYIAYLSDVMVKPDFQGKGIGRELVERCIGYIDSQLKKGWRIKIVLISSLGNEGFYERLGFRVRPNEKYGSGMDLWRK